MYKTIVSGKVRKVFDELSNGNCELLLSGLAPDAVHIVDGEHSLSGLRSTPEDIRAWYERIQKIFPKLSFTVHDVVVKGMPWKTTAIAVWEDSSNTALDDPYKNSGVNVIELSWGKVRSVRIYTNTQLMSDYLGKLGPLEPEAVAAPITS